ncbi:MAG TPA: FAD-dependent oxidoreductase, partial [Bacteroidia bacterium]|nr:FAD-dependent oxidoreductase [Bacteroidia bacterium]
MAGSVLSLQLIEKGFKVIVIDEPSLSASSRVAAGIWNPVVFKRLTKSWMVDEILPVMLEFYQAQEKKFGVQLLHHRNIIKLFSELQEVNLWFKKASAEMSDYLDKEISVNGLPKTIKLLDVGYAKVLRAGNLNLPLFLNTVTNNLQSSGMYLQEKFDFSVFSPSLVKYKDIEARYIVFCEGYLISKNPLFKYIPMKPAKGEVLTMQMDDLKLEKDILNKNAFIMPLENNLFKVGATYNWNDLSDSPTEEAKLELLNKLNRITELEGNVIRHEAGVRPSVIDRRPVLGAHPAFKNVFVFNGMGTKGVMLAPFFVNHLVEHITQQKKLNKEVDI